MKMHFVMSHKGRFINRMDVGVSTVCRMIHNNHYVERLPTSAWLFITNSEEALLCHLTKNWKQFTLDHTNCFITCPQSFFTSWNIEMVAWCIFNTHWIAEIEMLSFWSNICHWLHWKAQFKMLSNNDYDNFRCRQRYANFVKIMVFMFPCCNIF